MRLLPNVVLVYAWQVEDWPMLIEAGHPSRPYFSCSSNVTCRSDPEIQEAAIRATLAAPTVFRDNTILPPSSTLACGGQDR